MAKCSGWEEGSVVASPCIMSLPLVEDVDGIFAPGGRSSQNATLA